MWHFLEYILWHEDCCELVRIHKEFRITEFQWRKVMCNKLRWLSAATLVVFGATANAADIDLFTTDQANLVVTSAGTSDQSTKDTGGTDIIGGERDLYVEMLGDTGAPGFDTSSLGVAGGQLRFSNSVGVTGTGQIQWDGNDNDASFGTTSALGGIDADGLGGFDLTEGGTINAFLLETIESDLGYQFAVTIFEYDGDADNTNNKWVTVLFDASAVDGSGPSVLSTISFAGFTTVGLCGQNTNPPLPGGVASIECSGGNTEVVDMTNVGAIVVDLNTGSSPTTNIDLRLGSVTTVPEPSVLALMGIGLFVAGFTNIVRRKKSLEA